MRQRIVRDGWNRFLVPAAVIVNRFKQGQNPRPDSYATSIRLRLRLLTKFIVQTTRGQDSLGPLLISQAEIAQP